MKKLFIFFAFSCFLFSQDVFISPKEIKESPFKPTITENGCIKIEFKGKEYFVNSEFSLPDGKWAKIGKEKTEEFKNIKLEKNKFYCETDYFSLEREIKKEKECLVVKDKIKNKTNELLPLITRHYAEVKDVKECYLAGLKIFLKRGTSSDPANPTTILITDDCSIGFLPLNDVFRVHIRNFFAKDLYGISDNNLVLRPNIEYEMRWAVFVIEEKDYFAQINAMRRFLDVNFTIPGSSCIFTWRRKKNYKINEEFQKWLEQFNPPVLVNTDMSLEELRQYFNFKNAYFVIFGPVSDTQNFDMYVETDPTYIKDLIKRIKEAKPDSKVLPYFHCFIETSKNAKEKYKDAITLNPDGSQADYGKPDLPLFFPTLENSYGKIQEKEIELLLDKFGYDGIYWDEFEYSRAPYHYGEPHDGWSADIDPKTHKIIRLKSSITLITQPWRIKQVEKILNERKLPLVINGNPHTETILKYKVPRFVETGSISNCVRAHLFTPIALGDHLTERSEKDCYRKMLEALDYGCVYYWYYYFIWPEYPTLTSYMFPITPIEINKGYIIGKERIITKVSGNFGWGDKSEVEVHFFDKDGKEIKKEIEKIQKDGVNYYKVVLNEYESCVLIRVKK